MNVSETGIAGPLHVSIGIIAWNEERAIGAALESLFRQNLFQEMAERGLRCEIVCVPNACTDRTAEIAERIFGEQSQSHSLASVFRARVVPVAERGKINAWNLFVHSLSAPEARFLFLMDADIVIHRADTLRLMLAALENNPEASIATDRPCKDVLFKRQRNVFERVSVGASRMTGAAEAQLCGQLYCIRAGIARNIYLPKDLPACEDGFVKALVCTDFLTRPALGRRIVVAEEAAHTFEAYTSVQAVFKNQKRQMIGQTVVHLLVDNYLKALSLPERVRLGETLREKDRADPDWLRRLIGAHVRQVKFFWQLYPGLLSHRFRRLQRLPAARRILCFPAAVAGWAINLAAGFAALSFLKSGYTGYWPHGKDERLHAFEARPNQPSLRPIVSAETGGRHL